jgi:hypothetical protein
VRPLVVIVVVVVVVGGGSVPLLWARALQTARATWCYRDAASAAAR